MSAVQTLEEVKESKCNEKPRHIRFLEESYILPLGSYDECLS